MMESARAKVVIESMPMIECVVRDGAQLKIGGVTKVKMVGAADPSPLDIEFTGKADVDGEERWFAKLAPLDQTEELAERCKSALAIYERTGGPITRAHLSLAFQRLVDQVGGSEVDEFCRTIICSLIAGTPIKD